LKFGSHNWLEYLYTSKASA